MAILIKTPDDIPDLSELKKLASEKNSAKKIEVPSIREMVEQSATVATVVPKRRVTLYLDQQIIDKAKDGGRFWQTRINDFLLSRIDDL